MMGCVRSWVTLCVCVCVFNVVLRGAFTPERRGPVGSVSLSLQLCFDIKNVSMLQRGDPTRSEATDTRTALVPGRYSSYRGSTDGKRNLAVGINLSAGAKNY